MMNYEEDLRKRFQLIREQDLRSVPSFKRMWNVPSFNTKRPRKATFAIAVCILAVFIGSIYLLLRNPAGTPPAADITLSLTEWKAPTDFLLETPGKGLLSSIPEFEFSIVDDNFLQMPEKGVKQ